MDIDKLKNILDTLIHIRAPDTVLEDWENFSSSSSNEEVEGENNVEDWPDHICRQ